MTTFIVASATAADPSTIDITSMDFSATTSGTAFAGFMSLDSTTSIIDGVILSCIACSIDSNNPFKADETESGDLDSTVVISVKIRVSKSISFAKTAPESVLEADSAIGVP